MVHLVANLRETVAWADRQGRRWAFTPSNAGSSYFQDFCDLADLDRIDWDAVDALEWRSRKEGKQAEFLIEREFPWSLVRRIGVLSQSVKASVMEALASCTHRPEVDVRPDWYY